MDGFRQFKDEVFLALGIYLARIGSYISELVEYKYKQLLRYR
jgi:hypothetical protein